MPPPTLDTLRALLAAEPFVPFRVTLVDGRALLIDDLMDAYLVEPGRFVVIHGEDILLADIVSIEPAKGGG